MSNLIYTYALVRSLYEQGEDYIDAFWPFIIKILPSTNFLKCLDIQNKLNVTFELFIPFHVLDNVIYRAEKLGFIERNNKRHFRLTNRGSDYLDRLETDKDVERRINELIEDIKNFFIMHNSRIEEKELSFLLQTFIAKNSEPLLEFVNPSVQKNGAIVHGQNSTNRLLLEYFIVAENKKPKFYDTLNDMILGSIISAILHYNEPLKMIGSDARKFRDCTIYIDTNLVISILDLDPPTFNGPANELFDLLKRNGFKLKIFDFTLDEICSLLSNFLKEEVMYPKTIGVDSLFSCLKRKGWTKVYAKEYISNIEFTLKEKGIDIEFGTNVNLKEYTSTDERLREELRKYKPDQIYICQNHDLAAIQKISEYRGRTFRNIEDTSVLFLTSDNKFSKYAYNVMNHRDNSTISEVILDRLLTNILWLKDPNTKLSLKSIIALFSKDLFVKKSVWKRFYEVLVQLKKTGKVNNDQISMLFYNQFIEEDLKTIDDSEVDSIDNDFVLDEIEKASKIPEKEFKRMVEIKEKELQHSMETKISEKTIEIERDFIQNLDSKLVEKEIEKDAEWAEKIQQIKKETRIEAEEISKRQSISKAKLTATIVSIIVLSIIFCVAIKLYVFCKEKNVVDLYSIIISIVAILIGGTGIVSLWRRLRNVFQNNFSRSVFSKTYSQILNEKIDDVSKL